LAADLKEEVKSSSWSSSLHDLTGRARHHASNTALRRGLSNGVHERTGSPAGARCPAVVGYSGDDRPFSTSNCGVAVQVRLC
jgi:hypothetical protein